MPDLSSASANAIIAHVAAARRAGDIVVASVHWGSNWGYEVSPEQTAFARRLVRGGVDVVHGHSSHHVRPIEVYEGKLILYGCGDLVTDYEGIRGHESWRGDLGAMYFVTVSRGDGKLKRLRIAPMQMCRMRLDRATPAGGACLRDILNRISQPFGTRFEPEDGGLLTWQAHEAAVHSGV